ncbi:MAG: hypothetical protein Q4B58_07720 [Bacteroidales bacterium]|nr:hypothetical protein [Bacteroidales bacterium]
MKKNTNLCVDLKTVMQQDALLVQGQCYNGILTRDDDLHYRFEEVVRKGSHPRNPKLFDGQFISMVRMQNGRYQCHLKTFDPAMVDAHELGTQIYLELIKALSIIG